MKVENKVTPDPERMQAFFGPEAPKTPFVMVNLLKFKEKAEYADGRATDLSGADSYAIYASAVRGLIEALGGRAVHDGAVTGLMLGEVEELWDRVALVEYPSSEAFQRMVQSPEYQEIHVHRDAGLAGQLNIRTKSGTVADRSSPAGGSSTKSPTESPGDR